MCSLKLGCVDSSGLFAPEFESELLDTEALDTETLDTETLDTETLDVVSERQAHALIPDVVCAQCHPRQALEYATATMRYGFASPTFNALELSLNQLSSGRFTHQRALEGAQENAQEDQGAFCSDCHGPAATARGLEVNAERASATQLSLVGAREGGIGCDVCHTAHEARAPSTGLHITPSYDKLAAHVDPSPNSFHGYVDATPDQRAELSASEFCAPCHDVRPAQADVVSGASHLRSEDLFSEWSSSPWADPEHPLNPLRGMTGIEGVHDDPELIARGEQVTCQDCHMSLYPRRRFTDTVRYDQDFSGVDPRELTRKAHKLYPVASIAERGHLNQGDQTRSRRVSTHYFSGVSHPLTPFDSDAIFALDALEPHALVPRSLVARAETSPDVDTSVELSAETWRARWDAWRAHEETRVGSYGEPRAAHIRRAELLRAALTLGLDEIPERAQRGASLTLDAWIENTGAGHNVPAGFSQEREIWVALTLIDQGRTCADDAECADLMESPRFLDAPNRYCAPPTHTGARDPALPEDGAWEAAARAERSAVCGAERRCVIYRSGYLLDLDGDGRVHDEDLRHVLIDRDPAMFEERCVLPGPDADARIRGVERGLIHFTNALQRVEVDEEGAPVEHPALRALAPTGARFDPGADPLASLSRLDPTLRRDGYATARALYEQWRYRPAPLVTPGGIRRGVGLSAPTLLGANRAFNGHALRPFEPRRARYQIKLPERIVGPLKLDVKVRFRFFSPRLLRTLMERHPELVREEMLDAGLEIINLAHAERFITVDPPSMSRD